MEVLSPKLGDYAGKSVVIARALYRLKSVGTSFNAHPAQCTW